MKQLCALLALAMILSACGSADEPAAGGEAPAAATTAAPSTAPTVAPPSTTGGEADDTSVATTQAGNGDAAPAVITTDVEGEPAPDFTLALADGTTFDLSDETKPVYMVFWAEW